MDRGRGWQIQFPERVCGPVVGFSREGGQKFQLEETISKSLIGKHDLCRNSLRPENLVDNNRACVADIFLVYL